jgi:hypothetical protein
MNSRHSPSQWPSGIPATAIFIQLPLSLFLTKPQLSLFLKPMKSKKENISMEQLAMMVQRGFAATATKEDLRSSERRLTREIEGLELEISSYGSSSYQEFERFQKWLKEHEQRMERVEKALGIKK